MWLVNAVTLKLEHFISSNIPKYGILSHTWEDEEVTFQELALPSAVSKKGYIKIKRTCAQALKHGLQYAWIDTCCIDKTSSSELTESINSMFQWYQMAARCYVFLSDLPPGASDDKLASCRWFTRGWTLQELIAPSEVRFYDQEWTYVGTKKDFCTEISSITRINEKVLLGDRLLRSCSVATRMSWAAYRETARIEDQAYSLLGIFDVNMPLIYGEGPKSFRRLQEEILKHNNDLTIFAWDEDDWWEQGESPPRNLFAPSPAGFAESYGFQPFNRASLDPVFTVSNRGLRIDNFKLLWKKVVKGNSGRESTRYFIPLGSRRAGDAWHEIAIQLQKTGPDVFSRCGKLLTTSMHIDNFTRVPLLNFYLFTGDSHAFEASRRQNAIYFPRNPLVEIKETIPESHWDETNQLFFAPLDDASLVLAASCEVTVGAASKVEVVVCISYGPDIPLCRIFNSRESTSSKQQHYSWWLFRHKRLGHDVTWDDIQADVPELLEYTDRIEVEVDGTNFCISISIAKNVVRSISDGEIYSLNFGVDSLDRVVDDSVNVEDKAPVLPPRPKPRQEASSEPFPVPRSWSEPVFKNTTLNYQAEGAYPDLNLHKGYERVSAPPRRSTGREQITIDPFSLIINGIMNMENVGEVPSVRRERRTRMGPEYGQTLQGGDRDDEDLDVPAEEPEPPCKVQ